MQLFGRVEASYHFANFPEYQSGWNTVTRGGKPAGRAAVLLSEQEVRNTLFRFGLGIGFMVGHPYKQIDLITNEEHVPNCPYNSLQLTAIGVRAGAEHWFGTAELGFGAHGGTPLGARYTF